VRCSESNEATDEGPVETDHIHERGKRAEHGTSTVMVQVRWLALTCADACRQTVEKWECTKPCKDDTFCFQPMRIRHVGAYTWVRYIVLILEGQRPPWNWEIHPMNITTSPSHCDCWRRLRFICKALPPTTCFSPGTTQPPFSCRLSSS